MIFFGVVLVIYLVLVNYRYFSCHRAGRYENLMPVHGVLVERSPGGQGAALGRGLSVTHRDPMVQTEAEFWDYVSVPTATYGAEVLCCKYPCPQEKKRRRHPLPVVGEEYDVYVLEGHGSKTFQYEDPQYQYDVISCFSIVTLILTNLVCGGGLIYVLATEIVSLLASA
jgi:hypothetical protein